MASFPWIETSEGVYEQKYGFMERFFTRFPGKEGKTSQFTIAATIKFRFNGPIPDLEHQLRETWRAMRYYSPSIASTTGPEGKIYEVPNDESLKK
jgi:hypothetical protein